MILLSWGLLLAVLIIAFLLQAWDKQKEQTPLDAALTPTKETVLNAYLRQTVEYRGEQIPFAELIEIAILSNDEPIIKKKTEEFIALLDDSYKHSIGIYLPGDNPWMSVSSQGELQDNAITRTTLLIQDGRKIDIDYRREKND